MKSCLRLIALWLATAPGLISAAEVGGIESPDRQRPTTPREANAFKLARQQEQLKAAQARQQKILQDQAAQQQALQQAAVQQESLQQQWLLWQQQQALQQQAASGPSLWLPQGRTVVQRSGTQSGSQAFPTFGAWVYEGRGPNLGGAMPRSGAYVYNSRGSFGGGGRPANGAYAYQGRTGSSASGASASRSGK